MKILIADDTKVVQLIIERAIKKCGFTNLEIEKSNNGEEAFLKIQSWAPDLVITDWHMPVMSGLDLLKNINNSGLSNTKVGLITAEPSQKKLDEARRYGAVFIINKPCTEDEIIEKVLSVLDVSENSVKTNESETEEQSETDPEKPGNINTASLKSVLEKEFGSLLSITEVNKKPVDEFYGTFLITLYGSPSSNSIKAMSIVDKNAINLFGGLLSKRNIEEIDSFNKKTSVDSDIAKLAIEFLALHASEFFKNQSNEKNKKELKIKSKGIVSQLPEKVRNTIDNAANRKDYIIRYDERYVCFMSLTIM